MEVVLKKWGLTLTMSLIFLKCFAFIKLICVHLKNPNHKVQKEVKTIQNLTILTL